MKHGILSLLTTLAIWACSDAGKTGDQLLGSWMNTELKVKMNTFQNQDTTRWLIAREGEWEKVLKIKPIVTTYFPDGTFRSEYKDLNDDPIGLEEGKWQLMGDTLKLSSSHYHYDYKLYMENDKIRFVALVDWDEDGKKDDLYDGWQVRVKP